MALAPGIDFETQDVEILRVEEEYEVALVRVSDGGSSLPPPPPRTRWVFLKDMPRGLVQREEGAPSEEGGRALRPEEAEQREAKREGEEEGRAREEDAREEGREGKEGKEEERVEESAAGRESGDGCLQQPRKDERKRHQHQQQQQQQHQQGGASQRIVEGGSQSSRGRGGGGEGVLQEPAVANGDQRPGSGESSQPTQGQQGPRHIASAAREDEIAGGAGVDHDPKQDAAVSAVTPPQQTPSSESSSSSSSNNNNNNNNNNSNNNNDNTCMDDDDGLPSPTPLPPAVPPPPPPPPPPLPPKNASAAALTCSRYMLEVKPSTCSGGGGGNTGTAGVVSGGRRSTEGSAAGLGVFCKNAVLAGDVIFEEEALLKVDRREVAPRVWSAVSGLARKTQRFGIRDMDILQAVAFDAAPPSVRRSVLRLHAPDEEAFGSNRRQAWKPVLPVLDRLGVLSSSTSVCRSAGRAEATRGEEADERFEAERRVATLYEVIRICDANIFGEEDDAADGPRTLFEVACRINHDCLPNCNYQVVDHRIVIRAAVDLAPASELLISYLPIADITKPTLRRREVLLEHKFFECHCSRCDAEHDVWRGFRCPRCHRGVVRPPNCNTSRRGQQEEWQKGHEQRRRPQQLQPASPSSTPASDTGCCGSDGGGDAPLAVGVSACTACGRVPTARWLESAEALEERLGSWMRGPSKTVEKPSDFRVLQEAYAVGVYLFAEHHLLCTVHREMAEVLRFFHQSPGGGGARPAVIAYHYHQLLVVYDSMLGRTTEEIISKYEDLSLSLFDAALERPASKATRDGRASSTIDGGTTYADLVLSPVSSDPGPRSPIPAAAHDGEQKLDSGGSDGGGDCAVCGRRHGDTTRPARGKSARRNRQEEEKRPRGFQHRGAAAGVGARYRVVTGRALDGEDEGGARGGKEKGLVAPKVGDGESCRRPWSTERRLYQEDCQRARLRAIELAEALYGPDARRVADLCEVLERMQEFIARDA